MWESSAQALTLCGIGSGDLKMRYFALGLAALTLTGCVVVSGGPNEVGGSLAGAGAGALIGSQIGAGSGNLAAIGAGAALGAIIGGSLGQSVDRANAAPYYGYASPPYVYVPPPPAYYPPPRYYPY
jgi:hypothetical protein